MAVNKSIAISNINDKDLTLECHPSQVHNTQRLLVGWREGGDKVR